MTNRYIYDIINIPTKRKGVVVMYTVKSKNKKTGVTYVYESESYWDKEKKQPRNRRKLIGKLDEAGNIIPTGRQGRHKKTEEPAMNPREETELMESLAYYQDKCRALQTENSLLTEKINVLMKEKEALISGLETLIRNNR